MTRAEFSKVTKRAALKRSGGLCEAYDACIRSLGVGEKIAA